jgi:hypothetical protein
MDDGGGQVDGENGVAGGGATLSQAHQRELEAQIL